MTTTLAAAVQQVFERRAASGQPMAIVVAGHNGSGKSTIWNERLGPEIAPWLHIASPRAAAS